MSFGVMAGMETGVPGRLMPLRAESTPPTFTRQRTSFPSTATTSRRMEPSLISTGSPIDKSSGRPSYEQENRCAVPRMAGSTVMVVSAPDSSRTFPPSILPTRILGPCRSSRSSTGRPAFSAALLATAMARAWSSSVPCARFSRATSIPASTSLLRVGSSRDAGPMVQMILALRIRGAERRAQYPRLQETNFPASDAQHRRRPDLGAHAVRAPAAQLLESDAGLVEQGGIRHDRRARLKRDGERLAGRGFEAQLGAAPSHRQVTAELARRRSAVDRGAQHASSQGFQRRIAQPARSLQGRLDQRRLRAGDRYPKPPRALLLHQHEDRLAATDPHQLLRSHLDRRIRPGRRPQPAKGACRTGGEDQHHDRRPGPSAHRPSAAQGSERWQGRKWQASGAAGSYSSSATSSSSSSASSSSLSSSSRSAVFRTTTGSSS